VTVTPDAPAASHGVEHGIEAARFEDSGDVLHGGFPFVVALWPVQALAGSTASRMHILHFLHTFNT
jgi:hypothetical protein